ncbi:hypothetical protein ACOCEA_11720 [Maribacter sp. CXY002]|uniref:hypothetical protein n=1 Tax=Maribacter luteocoastalis TaxID=3407671 RepID=UPI003B670A2A
MKKASVLLGIGILSLLLLSFAGKPECEKSKENQQELNTIADLQNNFVNEMYLTLNTEPVNIDEITFIEIEEEIDLGFNTADYLPIGFNAYQGMDFTIDDIDFTDDEEIDLGFDTSVYLPKGFNAYVGMEIELEEVIADLDIDDLLYLLEEEEIDLGFDTAKYLPEGFDAYAK